MGFSIFTRINSVLVIEVNYNVLCLNSLTMIVFVIEYNVYYIFTSRGASRPVKA